MATYQGMPFIRQQLESILVQLAPEDEIIVSDNGSTDGTMEYLTAAAGADSRIHVFSWMDSKGISPNFQNALYQCRGDLIFLCDQDDIWLRNKIDTLSGLFADCPRLLAVQSDAELIDSSDRTIAPSFFAVRKCGSGVCKNIWKNTWQGCNMAFRREILELALPFPRSIPMHDMWIGILSELSGDVRFIPDILARYRRHAENSSAMKRSGWSSVLIWRLHLVWAILRKMPQIRKFRKQINAEKECI